MTLALYGHPFSSYCQKVITALHENGTPFALRLLDAPDSPAAREFAELWPLQHMPVLVDAGRAVIETSVIIEHLDLHHPGPQPLIPRDAAEALEVRFLDRFFDNYVMTPMQRIVFDFRRAPERRDAQTVEEARVLLERAYRWLDERLADRPWACGEAFSLADCAAAPALFYADWVQPIGAGLPHVEAYRRRLLARPSFARAVDAGRPYRSLFPPGAPDRD